MNNSKIIKSTSFLSYQTTADTATTTETSGDTEYLTLGDGLGVRLDHSCTSTLIKGICNCTNYSTNHGKTDLLFKFGTPSTTQQKERVYEQTYFYIKQGVSADPDRAQCETLLINPCYKCDSVSVSGTHNENLSFTWFKTK